MKNKNAETQKIVQKWKKLAEMDDEFFFKYFQQYRPLFY